MEDKIDITVHLRGLDDLLNRGILYSLRRDYDAQRQAFDYVLHASSSLIGHVDIKLEPELGRTLAQCWSQTDAGSFVGRHNMEWIIDCLSSGRPI